MAAIVSDAHFSQVDGDRHQVRRRRKKKIPPVTCCGGGAVSRNSSALGLVSGTRCLGPGGWPGAVGPASGRDPGQPLLPSSPPSREEGAEAAGRRL